MRTEEGLLAGLQRQRHLDELGGCEDNISNTTTQPPHSLNAAY
jgi:hypothetical protein